MFFQMILPCHAVTVVMFSLRHNIFITFDAMNIYEILISMRYPHPLMKYRDVSRSCIINI